MKSSPFQQLDLWARRTAPFAITLFVVVLSFVPLRLPAYFSVAPDFVLMAVFYWTVHRSDLMRSWSVFVVGLFDDLLSGGLLGLNALTLLLVHWAIVTQHKVFRGKPFGPVWAAFAVVATATNLFVAILAYALARAPVDMGALGVQYALTVALYPVLAWLLGRAQRAFLPVP
ncbi:MAG: rod shape-determining protein MreD [Rhodospirillales bacterium]|nr:rod shape-determining protein MreD [Rhodospirillales bacterium]